MAEKLAELYVSIEGRMTKLESSLKKAETRSKVASNKIKGYMKGIGTAFGAMFAGAGVLMGLKKGFDAFVNLDKGMREVNTIAKLTEKELKRLTSDVVGLSNKLGTPTSDLTGAMYQAVSAGVEVTNVMKFMDVAVRTAIGGMTNTETAVDALTTVMNAWKLTQEDLTDVSDIMFKTVELGKTKVDELAASYSLVAPLASASGVSFKEVSVAVAQLTSQGTPTSVAMTQISASIIALKKNLGENVFQTHTLTEAMQIRMEEYKKSGKTLTEYLGRKEAELGLLGLVGDSLDATTKKMIAMENRTGAAKDAFEEMEKSMARKIEKIKANIENSMIKVVDLLIIQLGTLGETADNLVPKIKKFGDAGEEAGISWDDFTEAVSWWYKNVALFVPKAYGHLIQLVSGLGVVSDSLREIRQKWLSLLDAIGIIEKKSQVDKTSGVSLGLGITSMLSREAEKDLLKSKELVKSLNTEFDMTKHSIDEVNAEISRLQLEMGKYNAKSDGAKKIMLQISALQTYNDLAVQVDGATSKIGELTNYLEDLVSGEDELRVKIGLVTTALKDENITFAEQVAYKKELIELNKELYGDKPRPSVEGDFGGAGFGREAPEREMAGNRMLPEQTPSLIRGKVEGVAASDESPIDNLRKDIEAAKEEFGGLDEYLNELTLGEAAFTSLSDGLARAMGEVRIRFAQDASAIERIAGQMANSFIAQVQRMIAQWLAFQLLKGVLAIPTGGASMAFHKGGTVEGGKASPQFAHKGGTFTGGKKVESFKRGGEGIVPAGYPNDSFPVNVESGEKLIVIPRSEVNPIDKIVTQAEQIIEEKGKELSAAQGGIFERGKKIETFVKDSEKIKTFTKDSEKTFVKDNKKIFVEDKTFEKGRRVPAFASGGDFMVPSAGRVDWFPMLVSPNERVRVTPVNKVGDEEKAFKQMVDRLDVLNASLIEGQENNQTIDGIPLYGKLEGQDIWLSNRKTNKRIGRMT